MKLLLFLFIPFIAFGQIVKHTGNEIKTSATYSFSGKFIEATAGEDVAFGNIVYWNPDSLMYYLSDPTDTTKIEDLAMVVDSTIDSGYVGRFLINGFAKNTAWTYGLGDELFLDTSSSFLPQYYTNYNKKIAKAYDSTVIYFNNELSAYYWDDLRTPVSTLRLPGSNAPTPTDYFSGQVLAFPTSADAVVYFLIQMPHRWIIGTTIEPHIHYSLSADASADDSVKWVFTYEWVNITGTLDGADTITIADDLDEGKYVDSTHYLFDIGTLTPPAGITGVSSMLICSLRRDVSEDNYGGSIYLWEIDFHYLSDNKGSRYEYIK